MKILREIRAIPFKGKWERNEMLNDESWWEYFDEGREELNCGSLRKAFEELWKELWEKLNVGEICEEVLVEICAEFLKRLHGGLDESRGWEWCGIFAFFLCLNGWNSQLISNCDYAIQSSNILVTVGQTKLRFESETSRNESYYTEY
jgi:hypothetical protein